MLSILLMFYTPFLKAKSSLYLVVKACGKNEQVYR